MFRASTPPNIVEIVVRGRFLILERITSTPTNLFEVVVRERFETGTVASIPPVFVEAIVRRTFDFGVFGE